MSEKLVHDISDKKLIFLVLVLIYSLFHKTIPRSSLQMHWISVRFYEICDTKLLQKRYKNLLKVTH